MEQPIEPIADRYQILAPLGRGGLATIYKAFDQIAGRFVTLKTVKSGGPEASRLFREATVLEQLTQRNIVQMSAWGTAEELAYLVLNT